MQKPQVERFLKSLDWNDYRQRVDKRVAVEVKDYAAARARSAL